MDLSSLGSDGNSTRLNKSSLIKQVFFFFTGGRKTPPRATELLLCTSVLRPQAGKGFKGDPGVSRCLFLSIHLVKVYLELAKSNPGMVKRKAFFPSKWL